MREVAVSIAFVIHRTSKYTDLSKNNHGSTDLSKNFYTDWRICIEFGTDQRICVPLFTPPPPPTEETGVLGWKIGESFGW